MIYALHQPRKANEKGFTIPELMIVLFVTGLFVSIIMVFTFSYWRYGYLQEADLDTFTTRLNAGDYFREAIGSSSGMISQNSIPDPYAMNPDTSIAGGQYWIPIHAIPTNIPIGSSGTTPIVYFRQPSKNSSGVIIMNGTQPYEDEYVAYMDAATKQLLIRSLANPSATGNRLKTSCPAVYATTTCPADKIIVSDLASVDLRFFSRTGNLIDYTSIIDSSTGAYIGPDYQAVEVLELTLNISKKSLFQTSNATFNSTIIRVALRNS
jgi:prepilin-type N-terminal cleavage/methylation domain-containing protein